MSKQTVQYFLYVVHEAPSEVYFPTHTHTHTYPIQIKVHLPVHYLYQHIPEHMVSTSKATIFLFVLIHPGYSVLLIGKRRTFQVIGPYT